ncbi:MAG: DUF1254 domain-containing protein [Halioglobus sp.]|nr:DUF1254 domain-containing protein [Halioglobus sp.]
MTRYRNNRFIRSLLGAAFCLALLGGRPLLAEPAAGLSPEEAQATAIDAYIYGYSLVTTEVTRVQMSNVPEVEQIRAPTGTFFNVPGYPPADYRGVSAANADTLYSVAWLDLTEPQVFSHPEINNRFFTFELVDLWMIVKDSVGTNTSGEKAMTYLFTGPDWKGTVPEGMTHISFPTRYMIILGRTYALNTPEDLERVHALQAQYQVRPLSAYGKPYTFVAPAVDPDPGFSMTEQPQKAILALGTDGYFNMMTRLMGGVAPAPAEDAPMLARMARLGILPGKPFDASKLDPAVQARLKDVPEIALRKMVAAWDSLGKDVNGWRVTTVGGRYGTDYLERAAWAASGWPSQLPHVSVYPTSSVDSKGEKLNGANKYTLTFASGRMPPVNPLAFWSITMYTIDDGLWFYPNALNKLTVSPRDKLVYNKDGSLTLYFQHESPGADKQANWLPAPAGPFATTLRLYWPNTESPSVLNGSWQPPGIVRVE